MRKLISTAALLIAFAGIFAFPVMAQTEIDPNAVEPTPEQQETITDNVVAGGKYTDSDKNNFFLMGGAAGAAIGLVIGGMVVWFVKPEDK